MPSHSVVFLASSPPAELSGREGASLPPAEPRARGAAAGEWPGAAGLR